MVLMNNVFKNKCMRYFPLLLQIMRFGVVGTTAATIHFLIVVSLVQFGSLAPLVANVFAFLISFQASYWGHRLWTFNQSATMHREAFPKLLFIQIINFSANESLFYVFLAYHYPYPIALLMVLTILPCFTFISSKRWIFR